MKTLAGKEKQFLTDAAGKGTKIVLDLETYQQFRKATEELADIHSYDPLRDPAHAEIAPGQSATLAAYRADRKRKGRAE